MTLQNLSNTICKTLQWVLIDCSLSFFSQVTNIYCLAKIKILSEKLGDITRLYKNQPKCFDIIKRELWCYICMVLLVAWDSEHDTTTPRYRLIFTCQHTHPYYSCLIPLPPISNELLWKQKQINKKPMACLFSIKSVRVFEYWIYRIYHTLL